MTPQSFNEWRIMPRLMVGLYGVLWFMTADWFMALDDPNNAQAAFVTAMTAAGAAVFKFYVETGGRDSE